MKHNEHHRNPNTLNANQQLSQVENTILTLLNTRAHQANTIIDVPKLQEDCLARGLTSQEFSHGFVRLLSRRLLEPRGEFTFILSTRARTL
jgi:hypothetical protein